MPQSTPERRARWGIDESKATEFLEGRGFVLKRDWFWVLPDTDRALTSDEADAISFLVEEWDYGGD